MTNDEREEKLDALRRFEQLRREHLGAAANLTFALASGGVGFCASLVTGKDQLTWTSPANYFFIAASLMFIAAVVLSMCLMLTRLQDFRLTARKLRLELRDADEDTINVVARKADRFGILTWGLYRSQLITFGLGMAFLVISLWLLYGHNIFPGSPVSERW
jgi:hypothetical protein